MRQASEKIGDSHKKSQNNRASSVRYRLMKTSQKIKTDWDLKGLLKKEDDKEISKEKKLIKGENYKFINKWKDRKDYLKSESVLKEALDEYEKLNRNYGASGNSGFYFYLKSFLDQNNPKIKAFSNNLRDFSVKIGNDLQFFEHNIARTPKENQNKFLSYKGLAAYRHFLERLFAQAEHLLSDAEEKILNLKHQVSHANWAKMLSGLLSKEERVILNNNGKKKKKTFSEIFKAMNSNKKKIRDSAASAVNDILEKFADVAENEMNSILANKKINDELRKMTRPDLARHIDDDVESETIDALVSAVSNRFDIARKYYVLKAKLLGLKKLDYHDRNAEYGKADKKYSYGETVRLANKVFGNLDKKFFEISKSMITKGKIDALPRKNKASGAFCASGLIVQPTYILLNHAGNLDDVLTFAHEMGHAINGQLQKEKQNALNFGAPKSTAEVASTFMEDFILDELVSGADGEFKLALMMNRLNGNINTIFRQIACYKFELELHAEFRKKGYLSKGEIGKLFQKHMASYMGPAVSQSEGSQNWWIYWGHIRSFFYNYSYAGGLLIAKTMKTHYLKDKNFMEKIKEFLSTGTADSPKNIFFKMGINVSDKKFWEDGLSRVDDLLKKTQKLAKKLGKI